ncbi:uncharacterized protein FA14DRAFT_154375 [Meira miltonrushii]|uniref:Uncharacterized protein n=1 Tax=Meira miltonrushii TaxID=1280837 RepID=A0A316VBC2_9BASI|nr:uncharacterized protein FA14DRAFT_154375 [Meira miltonrushii]PWN34939.1 hypothetical protein FA14DRAFT_154375 [Meira miltonrushii]
MYLFRASLDFMLFIVLIASAVKPSQTIHSSKPPPENMEKVFTTKVPDLNFPPPEEEAVEVQYSAEHGKISIGENVTKRKKKKRTGAALERHRIKDRQKKREARARLSTEERLALFRREREKQKERLALQAQRDIKRAKRQKEKEERWYSFFHFLIFAQCIGILAVKVSERSKAKKALSVEKSVAFNSGRANELQAKPIPDLNFPPPAEDVESVHSASPKSAPKSPQTIPLNEKSYYYRMIERKKREGTLRAWTTAKRERMKIYRANLPPEKKAENLRKETECKKKKLAEYEVAAVKAKMKSLNENNQSSQNSQQNIPESTGLTTTNKAPIPDLNLDPPPEEVPTTSTYRKGAFLKKDKDGRMKTRFAIYTQSREKKGTLNEFRLKERKRHKNYRNALPDDERIAKSKKYQKTMFDKFKQSAEARERRYISVRKAAQRFYARKRAKELGLEIKPEDAVKRNFKQPSP